MRLQILASDKATDHHSFGAVCLADSGGIDCRHRTLLSDAAVRPGRGCGAFMQKLRNFSRKSLPRPRLLSPRVSSLPSPTALSPFSSGGIRQTPLAHHRDRCRRRHPFPATTVSLSFSFSFPPPIRGIKIPSSQKPHLSPSPTYYDRLHTSRGSRSGKSSRAEHHWLVISEGRTMQRRVLRCEGRFHNCVL